MVNRTPKRVAKQVEQEPEYNDYFTAMETGESEKKPAQPGSDVSAQLEALLKRVDALQEQNDTLRAQYVAPPVQIVAQAPAPARQEQPEVIPDPILDAAGYTNWLLSRADGLVNSRIETILSEQQQQNATANAYDDLWTNFLAVDGNEVWEDEPEKVQVAVLKTQKKLAAKGVDVQKYMFQNSDKFFSDVSKTLEADFGKPVVEDNEEAGEETLEDVDRTAGLMGGQPAPVASAKGGKPSNAPDLYGDLVSIQRKGGWY